LIIEKKITIDSEIRIRKNWILGIRYQDLEKRLERKIGIGKRLGFYIGD
jgi:hypothetical protein